MLPSPAYFTKDCQCVCVQSSLSWPLSEYILTELDNLQEEFKTLEEKATKVLEDYEKAQVSHKYNL